MLGVIVRLRMFNFRHQAALNSCARLGADRCPPVSRSSSCVEDIGAMHVPPRHRCRFPATDDRPASDYAWSNVWQ